MDQSTLRKFVLEDKAMTPDVRRRLREDGRRAALKLERAWLDAFLGADVSTDATPDPASYPDTGATTATRFHTGGES